MSNTLIFMCLFGLLAIAVIFLSANGEHDLLLKRIDRIKKRGSAKGPGLSLQEMSLRRKTTQQNGFIYWLAKPLPNFKKLGNRLEKVGKTITPKQYVLSRLIYMVLITMVLTYVFKKPLIIGVLAGLLLGVWIPLKLLNRACTKYSKAFLSFFPDAIDLIVRGLRSGLPVSESLTLVIKEVPDPVGSVFANIANTMKLGVSLERALQETAKKMDMTEFNFFTTCIVLQRETGGNLSEILNNLSEVLRSRFMMRMKIRAMSSEARASSYIIGSLPLIVFILVMLTSPDYMKPFWTTTGGYKCAAVAVGMMSFGAWVMKRMTNFEI